MYNRRYDKVFIMLRQEVNGFSVGQQPAWGSCIMELKNKKGKLFVTVQGLKKLTDHRVYEFFIIGGTAKDMRGISCGNLYVDQYGKGELKWEFDPDAIGQSCFCVEQLHTVALLVKGGYGLTAPLAGYFNERVAWQKHFQQETEKKDLRAAEAILANAPKKQMANETESKKEMHKQQNVVPIQQSPPQQAPIQEQKEAAQNIVTIKDIEKHTEKKEEKTESVFQKNFKNMLITFKKELDQLVHKGVLSQEERKKITQANALPQKKEKTLHDTEKNDLKENKEITYILNHNDDIYPFEENDCWKSIALEELAILPVNALKMMHHSFFILAYRRYKHFIFQKTAQGEYYIGIPDQYQPKTRREAEQLLFSSFAPCKKQTLQIGCYGYWIRKIK